jgi:Protein of unknown function (DUF3558)
MVASRTALVVFALGSAIAVAGCGGSDNKTPAVASESAQSSAAPAAASIDACKLISADDITKLLGTPIEGKPTGTNPDMPGCIWENPANYESVSLEIGNPDTAINGTLPPPEPGFPEVGTPGPDGMRFLGGGSVEFAAGKRSNTVQVAVLSMLGETANNAAVDLARKIGSQLPQ